MSKKWIWLVGLVCCSMIAGMVVAEAPSWDADAAKKMSRDERLAAQRAYKAEVEALSPGGQKASEFTPAGRQSRPPNKAFGLISYHSGALGSCCTPSFMIGNQFDTGNLFPVVMSGSITKATFDMITVAPANVFISFYDQLAGTTANQITSILTPATTGLNTAVFGSPVSYVGTSFLGGVWQGGGDVPAVATGTAGGQGFHGIEINDIVGTGFATIGSLNAAFQVCGDILTPVELLNFELE